MKIIYLIRHSEGLKKKKDILNTDSLQLINEKNPLSVVGEERARKLSEMEEFNNIDVVIASNYVRAIATAKYIASKNDVDVNIIESFGERRFGINSWDELPEGFEKKQLSDETYKMPNGENRLEVAGRMYDGLLKVVDNYYQDKIVILSHATAITFLLMKLGEVREDGLFFNNKIVMEKEFSWNAPDIFKLTFDNKELIDIEHISLDF